MNNEKIKSIEVIDILEQIQKLNKMIALHQDSENDSMLKQYLHMKDSFVKGLGEMMQKLDIKINEIKEIGGSRNKDFYSPLYLDDYDLFPLKDIQLELDNFNKLQLQQGLAIGLLLLIAWAIFEAASRHLLKGSDNNILTPSDLVISLFDQEIISEVDKDWLLQKSKIRDSVAHGFKYAEPSLTNNDLNKIKSITTSLIVQKLAS